MYDYSYNWLILGTNMSHSVSILNDTGFSVVTDFVILLPDEIDYVLYDVYNHCKLRGSLLNVTKLGTWQQDSGLEITLNGSKIERRRNFHGLRAKSAGIVSSSLQLIQFLESDFINRFLWNITHSQVVHRPKDMSLLDYLEGDGYEIMDNWPKFGHTLLSHVSDIYNFT